MHKTIEMLRSLAILLTLVSFLNAQTREEIVRSDRQRVEEEGFWMYNDIPGAFAKAREIGKPIVVVLRCLPCEECVKLDDELVDTDPQIRPLLEEFVCVRQVATNGLDLNLFQYDTDQSFAMFFLNADGTIYGRFGTRSHRTEWVGDVSLEGLAKALEGALELHEQFGEVRPMLQGKRGPKPEVAAPELYPSLKDKFTSALDYEGDVVKSCIHCHQIGDAQREYYWHAKKAIPEKVLYPYPHPKVVGLVMDPNDRASVKDVLPDSPAAKAGLRAGDQIEAFDGQPMLSIADIQWVLHNIAPEGGSVPIAIAREGSSGAMLKLTLDAGWRQKGDLSWRVTSWGLRRIAAGGMVLEGLKKSEKTVLNLDATSMALRVKRVGKYGPHGAAKRAGIREGDIVVSYDGHDDLLTEQAIHSYVVTEKQPGQRVSIDLLRDKTELSISIPLQR